MNVSSRFAALVVLGGVALLAAASLYVLQPPVPAEESAPGFSAMRAFRYVEAIAQRPHSIGTDDHRRVRRYIISELQALGLETELQSLTITGSRYQSNVLSHVYNVMGRIKGQGEGKALLLVAHYDSQPNTPGAGDNASGVAILLEIARLMKKESPPQNDIVFLFTDGEEYGLFGARAFLRHPWFRDVGLVMNAEGRGNRGLSIAFEMSAENGWLVQEYGRVAPFPYANSLSYEVYKAMPNDTDFSVFRDQGLPGLNMAFIGGLVHYHSMTDTPANLSLRTLQHQGSNLLAMAKHFANLPLDVAKAPDRVFFNTLGFHLVSYPMVWDDALLVLAAIFYLCSLLLALVQKTVRAEALLYAFFAQIGLLVGAIALSWLMSRLVRALYPLSRHFLEGGIHGDTGYYLSFFLLCLLLYGGVLWALFRKTHSFSLAFGAQTLWLILAVSVHVAAPSAAYFFILPLLPLLAGQLVFQVSGSDPDRNPWRYALLYLLVLAPAVIMISPVLSLLYPAFGTHMPEIGSAVCALALALMTPLVRVVTGWRPDLLAYGVIAALVVSLGVVLVTASSRTAARPLQTHVSYYLDADEGKAFWVSVFADTDFWNEQFFAYPEVSPLSEIYPFARSNRMKSPARAASLPAPDIRVLADTTYRGQRHLGITVKSQHGACHMQLWVRNRKGVQQVSIDGELMKLDPTPGPGGRYYFWTFYGLPREREVNLDLLVSDLGATELVILDISLGLPPDLNYLPMPPEVIPGTGMESNLTVIRRTLEF